MRFGRKLRFNFVEMRILQISSAKHFGGGEKHLVDLSRGLHQKGHEVFVALRKENGFDEKLDFLGSENRLHVSLRNALDVLSAHKIAKFLRKHEIDIVHAHLARDYPPASMAVRLFPESKLIITRHVLFPMKGLHKLVLKNVSRAIAVSKAVERNLKNTFPEEKIVHIPNGIETEKWDYKDKEKLSQEFRFENNIPFDAKLICTIGELKKLKGQKDFISAAAEVAKIFPDTYFLIAGEDNSADSAFEQSLKKKVEELGLDKRFLFLEWTEDMTPLLSSMDVFVSPSHSESFGLAILEAMAAKTAVVATETAGAKELLDHTDIKVLSPIKDPSKLAENICGLLENDMLRENLGESNQKRAREDFSLEEMIEKTESLYQAVHRD